jgi:hypothetical protein
LILARRLSHLELEDDEPVLVFHDATVVAHQCRSFQGFPSKISNPSYMVYSSLLIIT